MKISLLKILLLWTTIILNNFSQTTDWEVVKSNTSVNLNSIYFYNHQVGIACGDSGELIISNDSGKTWQSLPSSVTVNLNDCFMFSEDCFLVVGDSGMVIFSWDGGNTLIITDLSEYGLDFLSVAFRRNYIFSPGMIGTSSQSILICNTNYCGTVMIDIYGGSPGGLWAAQMLNHELGFVAGENSISQPILGRTTNSGSTWDYVSFYLDGNEGRANGIAFTDSLIGYISAVVWDGRGAIAKTTDNGDNWTTTFFNNPLKSIEFPITETNQVGYCVGDSGIILKTNNAGAVWQNQNSGTTENLNKVFFIDSDFGFAVGDNGTILRTTNGGGATSVGEDENNEIPTGFLLSQNYPNPFNPSTKIKFTVPSVETYRDESLHTTLKVYDVLGNEVATLVNEYKPAGNYEVDFIVGQDSSPDIASGVYIYQLIVGNYIQSRKMLLLK